jgi:hypothetical protein
MYLTCRTQGGVAWSAGGGPSEFDEFIDATFPWEDGKVVMLKSYFDASSRSDTGVFCVAGVAFGIDRAKKFEREMRSLFGQRRCHMTDMSARKGEFEGVPPEQTDRLCRAAISAIVGNATAIAVVSCDVSEVEKYRPRETTHHSEPLADSMRSAYNCCLHWSMTVMGRMLATEPPQRVQYWFETGDLFQDAARRFLATINHPHALPLRQGYAYGSDVFAAKADVVSFDAADIVAWEWRKHVERFRSGAKERPSLTALMDGPCVVGGQPFHNTVGRYGNHFSGAPLVRFFDKMGAILRATSVAEIEAAVRRGDDLAVQPLKRP